MVTKTSTGQSQRVQTFQRVKPPPVNGQEVIDFSYFLIKICHLYQKMHFQNFRWSFPTRIFRRRPPQTTVVFLELLVVYDFPWFFNDFPRVLPFPCVLWFAWFFNGFPMIVMVFLSCCYAFLRIWYDSATISLWFSFCFPKCSCGIPMLFLWVAYGFHMVLLGVPMEFLEYSFMVFLWFS